MNWFDKIFGKKPTASARAKTPVLATVTLPPPTGEITAFGDQVLRKRWAEDVMRAEGVRVNEHLPMIESQSEVTLRPASEVATRLATLCIVAARGGGLSLEEAQGIIAEQALDPFLTPMERAFIETPEPDFQSRVQFSWRYEAAWVLFWALQHIDGPLGAPRRTCKVDQMVKTVIGSSNLAGHGLRSANDVLNEADLIYRYHWAVRQAGIDGDEVPAGLHPGVVMERHHALNWLIGYGDNADWDNVSTDT